MHVPDGFLDAPTSVATGAVAAVAVACSLRGARRELDDRTAPAAGLVATFVFAAQMINFPVAGGTSGHLLGGVLAAIALGPWAAMLVMTSPDRTVRTSPEPGRAGRRPPSSSRTSSSPPGPPAGTVSSA